MSLQVRLQITAVAAVGAFKVFDLEVKPYSSMRGEGLQTGFKYLAACASCAALSDLRGRKVPFVPYFAIKIFHFLRTAPENKIKHRGIFHINHLTSRPQRWEGGGGEGEIGRKRLLKGGGASCSFQ